MLSYKSIIDNLTSHQKIQLIANFYKSTDYTEINNVGIPTVKAAALQSFCNSEQYPKLEELAYTWDTELMGLIPEQLSVKAKTDGVNLIITPDLKAQVDPYNMGLSEDPYFNGTMGAAISRAIHASGAACGLSELSVNEKDTVFLDAREDEKAVNDLYVSPFHVAIEEGHCDAIVSTLDGDISGYAMCNAKLFKDITEGYFGKNIFAISKKNQFGN